MTVLLRVCVTSVAALLATAPLVQASSRVVSGTNPTDHVGLRVVGPARLATTNADSAWSGALGQSGLWFIRPGGIHPVTHQAPNGASNAFGCAGVSVSEFSTDDYDALVVGDPGHSNARGRVSIYLGRIGFDGTPSLTLEGEGSGDLFGASVASVGDVDGDGFGDLVVGAPGRGAGAGSAYLFRGGASPATAPAARYDGASPGDAFGASVAGGVDFDFDTHSDMAIGAPGAAGGVGQVVIIRGGAGVPSAVAQTLTSGLTPAYATRPRFGASLAAGDLTGDGIGDLVVGAPGASKDRGRSFVYAGATAGLSAHAEIGGTAPFDRLGAAVMVGEISGDGAADLVIGAPGRGGGRGDVLVLFGGASFDTNVDFTDAGEAGDDAFGFALALGDLFPQAPVQQILIGAPLADFNGKSSGALYMLALPPAVAVEAAQVMLEADGGPVDAELFLDPSIPLRARVANGAPIALERSTAFVDDKPCVLAATEDPGVLALALPDDIGDGEHRLRVTLATHEAQGTIERGIRTFRRFELISVRLGPSPARGPVEAIFVMTRRGAFTISVFDPSGRRVTGAGTTVGIAGENRIELPELSRRASGVYFYRIEATFAGRTISSLGRIVLVH
jgi:FG-GAP repeat protein